MKRISQINNLQHLSTLLTQFTTDHNDHYKPKMMTRVLAWAGQSKIGCITQRRFAKVGTKTHPQRGADLDRNGLSVSTETACRFEPKSPVGNSEICTQAEHKLNQARLVAAFMDRWFRDAEGKSLTAASHGFRNTAEFEGRLYEHLRALLERRLQPQGPGAEGTPESAIRWRHPPFRGLAAFEIEHAAIFFGRTRARHDLRELLARQAETAARSSWCWAPVGRASHHWSRLGCSPT